MEQLTQLLTQLAEKLGTTTEYLWEVLLKQAQVALASNSLFLLMLVIALVGCILAIKSLMKERDEDFDKELLLPILFVLAFIFTGLIIATTHDVLTLSINPEYWALKHVLNIIN